MTGFKIMKCLKKVRVLIESGCVCNKLWIRPLTALFVYYVYMQPYGYYLYYDNVIKSSIVKIGEK